MEWRVKARPVIMRSGRRRYAYAEVRVHLPPEYIGVEFIIKPVEGNGPSEPQTQLTGQQAPTWVGSTVEEMFNDAPDWVVNNPWLNIIRGRGR